MKYLARISPEAQANIVAAFPYIAQRSPMNAAKWIRELHRQIDGSEDFPRRFGEAREQIHLLPQEIRQVVFKSHRIIFTIDDASRTVSVVFVRHAKMRTLGEDEQE